MRADARENHDRVLEVAARAFEREGTGASLKAIAREAGVGIGTVYRRFPTREALVEAVYRQEVDRLCAAGLELAATRPGVDALREWMELFVDFMAAKRGLGETLRAVLTSDDDKQQTRDRLRATIAALLATEGVRPGIEPNDLLMALGGITLIAAEERQRELATRLVGLLLDGVRAR
ncbi:TetR/AcrR family transcriptional regulator [Paractinoplanes globisporus]|uniref:TetR/AcrR family transcriptional regulator n=1 Tax=Paractinoplanes globisporus TaxID=113565 RepID=A0ABW6WDP9_9ACTN|nr:TetR/AcrR family transcriptional regulator [Actinoplanes globisporus]